MVVIVQYNGAFKRLQKWRNMNPVTQAVLEESSKLATLPSAPQPESVPPSPSGRSPPDIPSEITADDKGSLVPEEANGVEEILNDLERGVVDETLPWLTEDDIAYDMDEVLIEVNTGIDTDESNTSDEGGNWEEG